MASVKDMRTRIGSVKSTQKITKAMQMVAAAKLRRAQGAAESARPYAARMASVIANLASGVSGPSAPRLLAGTGSDQRHLVVVATSDRGLAGGFNSGIARPPRATISPPPPYGQRPKSVTPRSDEHASLRALLPHSVEVHILSALLETQAGFFAAQMAAMDNATRNAGDMIKALTIQMNRTRQAQITKELIEIISGASAV